MEWNTNPDDFSTEDVTQYAAFVYLITFEDGSYYYGKKNVYIGIREAKKIKATSKESNWKTYTSSSKIVNQMIDDGYQYTKTILWCFDTTAEATIIETLMIVNNYLCEKNINMAIMDKTKIAKGKKEKLRKIGQYLMENY